MSCALGPDICLYRGDTYKDTYTVTDENDNPKDITGWTISFFVKRNEGASTPDLSTTATITDAVNGIAILQLTEANTDLSKGKYIYDVEFANSDRSTVKTYRGSFEVKQDLG